ACLPNAWLHCRRIPHPFLQPPEPARHRALGRQARRHPAQPPAGFGRNPARYLRLQHHRQRMADGEIASELAAEQTAGLMGPQRRKWEARIFGTRQLPGAVALAPCSPLAALPFRSSISAPDARAGWAPKSEACIRFGFPLVRRPPALRTGASSLGARGKAL